MVIAENSILCVKCTLLAMIRYRYLAMMHAHSVNCCAPRRPPTICNAAPKALVPHRCCDDRFELSRMEVSHHRNYRLPLLTS